MKLPLRAVLFGLALLPLCTFAQSGCTNPWACNYDPFALEDDGSCDLDTCAGCTISDACNFNPVATRDDGSCDFDCITGCTFGAVFEDCLHLPHAYNYNPQALIDDGSCIWESGSACPLDLDCDGTNSASDLLVLLGQFGTASSVEIVTFQTLAAPEVEMYFPEVSTLPVTGTCDHPQACNYDPESPAGQPCDWTSCTRCTYSWACNYDPDAVSGYVHCDFDCRGCTYEVATNYNPLALVEDGSCVIEVATITPSDINGDGYVDTPDLLQLMGAYGTMCPE